MDIADFYFLNVLAFSKVHVRNIETYSSLRTRRVIGIEGLPPPALRCIISFGSNPFVYSPNERAAQRAAECCHS
jgi:hypothetical protein